MSEDTSLQLNKELKEGLDKLQIKDKKINDEYYELNKKNLKINEELFNTFYLFFNKEYKIKFGEVLVNNINKKMHDLYKEFLCAFTIDKLKLLIKNLETTRDQFMSEIKKLGNKISSDEMKKLELRFNLSIEKCKNNILKFEKKDDFYKNYESLMNKFL